MDALDGNAIGGLLIDVFGTEMTAARSTCATCGDTRPVAELVVYRRAPGTVVRCRTCGSVLMVFVRRDGAIGTDLSGLASLDTLGGTGSLCALSPGQQPGPGAGDARLAVGPPEGCGRPVRGLPRLAGRAGWQPGSGLGPSRSGACQPVDQVQRRWP